MGKDALLSMALSEKRGAIPGAVEGSTHPSPLTLAAVPHPTVPLQGSPAAVRK